MNQKQRTRDIPLIPREVLFGNPDKASPRLSHDGKQLAFLARLAEVPNVWVAHADEPGKARAVTHDTDRGIVRQPLEPAAKSALNPTRAGFYPGHQVTS